MPPLPVLKPREVVRALERAGFVHVRQIGSHARMVRSGAYVTVAMHREDIARGTLKSILSQAGMTADEMLELLGK